MTPLIRDGQLVLVRRYRIIPSLGDLVIFPSPLTGKLNIKKCTAADDSTVFVTGINLPESTDSRHFGSIPKSSLTGIVLLY